MGLNVARSFAVRKRTIVSIEVVARRFPVIVARETGVSLAVDRFEDLITLRRRVPPMLPGSLGVRGV